MTLPAPVEEAVRAVRAGSLIVIPTDTVYGIAARPDDPAATGALFAAKGRPANLSLPVLADGSRAAKGLAVFDDPAEGLAAAFWPGPLTIVLRRSERSLGWELGGDPETIGVRVPRHPLATAVLASVGPLAVSSANRSGEPEAASCDELLRAFGNLVAVYLCQETPPAGTASTVVDLAHGAPRILRAGTIAAEVEARLRGASGPLVDSPSPQ